MKKYVWVLLFLPFAAFAKPTAFVDFKACYAKTSHKIQSTGEKAFLDDYLRYLDTGKDSDGRAAAKRILDLKPKDESRVASQWIGIFEGTTELCCSEAGFGCSYSFGSATREKLMPKIKKGNRTAIDLVLTYSALVETDAAESESLSDYQKIIRKNQKAVDSFIKTNKALLKSHSINWLVD